MYGFCVKRLSNVKPPIAIDLINIFTKLKGTYVVYKDLNYICSTNLQVLTTLPLLRVHLGKFDVTLIEMTLDVCHKLCSPKFYTNFIAYLFRIVILYRLVYLNFKSIFVKIIKIKNLLLFYYFIFFNRCACMNGQFHKFSLKRAETFVKHLVKCTF